MQNSCKNQNLNSNANKYIKCKRSKLYTLELMLERLYLVIKLMTLNLSELLLLLNNK